MSSEDLNRFICKINDLNKLLQLINSDPQKKSLLEACETHDQVVSLASSWGLQIGRRWGEIEDSVK